MGRNFGQVLDRDHKDHVCSILLLPLYCGRGPGFSYPKWGFEHGYGPCRFGLLEDGEREVGEPLYSGCRYFLMPK